MLREDTRPGAGHHRMRRKAPPSAWERRNARSERLYILERPNSATGIAARHRIFLRRRLLSNDQFGENFPKLTFPVHAIRRIPRDRE